MELARPGSAWRGRARLGGAGRGKARYGVARVVFDIIIHLSFSAPDIFTAGAFFIKVPYQDSR